MNYVAIGKVTGVRHSLLKNARREVSIDWVEQGDEDRLLGHSLTVTDEDGIFNIGNDVEIRITRLAKPT